MVRIISEGYIKSMVESDFVPSSFDTSGLLTFVRGKTHEEILPKWHNLLTSLVDMA
jgi:hypothetical protein